MEISSVDGIDTYQWTKMLQKLIKETESLEKMKGFSPNHPSLPAQYVEIFLDIIEVKTVAK